MNEYHETASSSSQRYQGAQALAQPKGRESEEALNDVSKRIEFLFALSSRLHQATTRICGTRPEPMANGAGAAGEISSPSLSSKLRMTEAGLSRLCNEIEDNVNRLDAFA